MPWQPLPGEHEDPPAPMHVALDRLLRDMGAAPASTVGSLFDRWTEIVGEGLASQARPVALRDGRLILAVPDPAWATQVRFLEADLLRRLADAVGPDEVRAIEIRVRPPATRRRPTAR